jgi:hypothetical protein
VFDTWSKGTIGIDATKSDTLPLGTTAAPLRLGADDAEPPDVAAELLPDFAAACAFADGAMKLAASAAINISDVIAVGIRCNFIVSEPT